MAVLLFIGGLGAHTGQTLAQCRIRCKGAEMPEFVRSSANLGHLFKLIGSLKDASIHYVSMNTVSVVARKSHVETLAMYARYRSVLAKMDFSGGTGTARLQ
jgi:hypothetical protein